MATEDSIDGSGHPLAFRVRAGRRAAAVGASGPARDVYRVEARKIFGHQKELVVTEGEGGSAFVSYSLPEAAIALKQGAGRLIRGERDRGALVAAGRVRAGEFTAEKSAADLCLQYREVVARVRP